jgi:hypothetical protein
MLDFKIKQKHVETIYDDTNKHWRGLFDFSHFSNPTFTQFVDQLKQLWLLNHDQSKDKRRETKSSC